MQLYYHIEAGGNFGDDLNAWIWDHLLPGWKAWDDEVTLFGIGTILNTHRLARFTEKRILVIGSGVGYGPVPRPPYPAGWDIRSVRGPRSARSLGLPASSAIIDPAMMLPELPEFRNIPKTGKIIVIPHVASVARHDWGTLAAGASIEFVSPRRPAREVVRSIAAASLVIAESMHAAIIADAFRVPWVPLKISATFNADKWKDWAESLELDLEISDLFPLLDLIDRKTPFRRYRRARLSVRKALERFGVTRQLRNCAAHQSRLLSEASVLEKRKQAYRLVLQSVVRDYG